MASSASSGALGFVHRFVPGKDPSGPVCLLLHGTGGDEDSMLAVGRALAPDAALLSPRGKVLENGTVTRFFRRLAEGVLDVPDLIQRTQELAEFVTAASGVYGFDPGRVFAVGYSNGANIGAGLLLLHPGVLAGAVLFRPMVPLMPELIPDLTGKRVHIAAGSQDVMVPVSETERLVSLFERAGAEVSVRFASAGHGLTQEEVETAREWVGRRYGGDGVTG